MLEKEGAIENWILFFWYLLITVCFHHSVYYSQTYDLDSKTIKERCKQCDDVSCSALWTIAASKQPKRVIECHLSTP